MRGRKGQVALYISLVFVILIIIIIAGLFAPAGSQFATELYVAGEGILIDSNETIQSIQNVDVRNALTDSVNEAQDSAVINIEVANNFYQYSWAIVIFITALVAFLYARRLVEFGQGGFV